MILIRTITEIKKHFTASRKKSLSDDFLSRMRNTMSAVLKNRKHWENKLNSASKHEREIAARKMKFLEGQKIALETALKHFNESFFK